MFSPTGGLFRLSSLFFPFFFFFLFSLFSTCCALAPTFQSIRTSSGGIIHEGLGGNNILTLVRLISTYQNYG
ncbi:hypothetical protein LY76DRAFT_20570 [Colletotrichum caudatum]|nr:hypothetical protein LY76DRAFT_20570 [Colletotrichum caudatum]